MDDVKNVSVAPYQPMDSARLERALDRLAQHCDVVTLRAKTIEERRPIVRERLEQELGPELAHLLLAGLVAERPM